MKAAKLLTPKEVGKFQKEIYAYYAAHGRSDLPWRNTRNSYRILVSEFMLQQTQVGRVIEKYGSFVRRFPDFDSLARSRLRDVLAEWNGLGYNRRALLLRETARTVVSRFGGKLPGEFDRLRALPGIGTATASGISAFAFGAPHAFIETNIRTVFIHSFFRRRKRVADAEILPLVERTLDRNDPRTWYCALMDYGVMLKKRYPNPSRKSAHHATQSRFEGSDRQARGLIVRSLAKRVMGESELVETTGLSLARIRGVIPGLARDGLVKIRGTRYSIG